MIHLQQPCGPPQRKKNELLICQVCLAVRGERSYFIDNLHVRNQPNNIAGLGLYHLTCAKTMTVRNWKVTCRASKGLLASRRSLTASHAASMACYKIQESLINKWFFLSTYEIARGNTNYSNYKLNALIAYHFLGATLIITKPCCNFFTVLSIDIRTA